VVKRLRTRFASLTWHRASAFALPKQFWQMAATKPGHNYPVVHISGNARAILGDVHCADQAFFDHVQPANRQALWLRTLYYAGMHARQSHISSNAGSPKLVE